MSATEIILDPIVSSYLVFTAVITSSFDLYIRQLLQSYRPVFGCSHTTALLFQTDLASRIPLFLRVVDSILEGPLLVLGVGRRLEG